MSAMCISPKYPSRSSAVRRGVAGQSFLFLWTIHICFCLLTETQAINYRLIEMLWDGWNYVFALMLLIWLVLFGRLELRELFFSVCMAAMILPIMRGSGKELDLAIFFLLTVCAFRIQEERLLKTHLAAVFLITALTIILYVLGIYTYEYIGRSGTASGVRRLYLGFNYTTTLPNHFFHATLIWFMMKSRKIRITETAVILAVNQLLFMLTDTKAVWAMMILFVALMWFIRVVPGICRTFLARGLSIWFMTGLALLMIFLSLNASSWPAVDRILNERLTHASQAFNIYGIRLFGAPVEWVTGRYGIERLTHDYFFVDSSYSNVLVSFGVIMFIYLLTGFAFYGKSKWEEKNYSACIALLLLGIHSFTDPQLFNLRYNPLTILLGVYWIRGCRIRKGYSMMSEDRVPMEREISFGAMVLRIARRWKMILFAGLLAAVICGGLKAYSVSRRSENVGGTETNEKLSVYQKKKEALEREIASVEQDILEKQEYLDHSIYANLNDYDLYEGSEALYISSSDPALSDQLSSYYLNSLSGGIDWSGFREFGDVRDSYLNELLFAEKDGKTVRYCVLYSDEQGASALLDYVTEKLMEASAQAEQSFGTHKVVFSGRKVSGNVKAGYEDRPYTRIYDIQELNMTMKALQAMREDLKKPSVPKGNSAFKSTLKTAVVAFFLAVVLVSVLVGIWLIAKDVFLAPSDPVRIFGIPLLAVINDGSGDALQKKLGNLDPDVKAFSGLKDPYGPTAELIACCTAEKKPVALIGDVSEERFTVAAERLERADTRIRCRILPNVSTDPAALQELRSCCAAVLLSETEKSRFRMSGEEIQAASLREVPVLGCIVFS